MRVRLNKRTIDEATYQGPGGCYLWDTEMAGFGVRIYPTGKKSFVVSYWSRGRRRFYTLGPFGKLTLHQAREEALMRVRSTYASFGINTGQNLAVIGKLLGHSKILTTLRYAHMADDPLRQANEQIARPWRPLWRVWCEQIEIRPLHPDLEISPSSPQGGFNRGSRRVQRLRPAR